MLFNVVLILSLLFETLAALSLIGGPGGIRDAGAGDQWTMHYGFAALAIASISVWTWPYRESREVVTLCLGVLLTFHTGLAISLTLAGDQQAGMMIHSVLAVLCLVLFIRRSAWCGAREVASNE